MNTNIINIIIIIIIILLVLFKIVSRTIGNAALAIVKGYVKPVDVMEIKVSSISFKHSL